LDAAARSCGSIPRFTHRLRDARVDAAQTGDLRGAIATLEGRGPAAASPIKSVMVVLPAICQKRRRRQGVRCSRRWWRRIADYAEAYTRSA
jgi:hypothetical protein